MVIPFFLDQPKNRLFDIAVFPPEPQDMKTP